MGDLGEEAAKMGLEIHFCKTEILSNVITRRGASAGKEIDIAGKKVEVLQAGESVAYLGRCVAPQDFDDREIKHRITRGWSKYAVCIKGSFATGGTTCGTG